MTKYNYIGMMLFESGSYRDISGETRTIKMKDDENGVIGFVPVFKNKKCAQCFVGSDIEIVKITETKQ